MVLIYKSNLIKTIEALNNTTITRKFPFNSIKGRSINVCVLLYVSFIKLL